MEEEHNDNEINYAEQLVTGKVLMYLRIMTDSWGEKITEPDRYYLTLKDEENGKVSIMPTTHRFNEKFSIIQLKQPDIIKPNTES